MGRGLLPAPLCALLRHAGVGSREQAQPSCPYRAAVLPEGGAPPRPWGGGGPRLWLPCCGGCGGGGGGVASPPALGSVRGGGGVGWGGPFGPLAMPLVGRGGGAAAALRSWSRGPAIGQGVAPFTRPPYREPDARAGPRRGPYPPGRCRAAPAGRGWPWGCKCG